MSMSRSGTVRANGQELYFEVHGQGPPLVLVMGIGYDATLWTLAQVPALSQMFQVVIFDNRDAGRSSSATGPYTIADMADDVAALMDALDIKRAHLLGLSMGGMIAQEFALRHAGRLHRLVLIAVVARRPREPSSIRFARGTGSRPLTRPARCSPASSSLGSSPIPSCATRKRCSRPSAC
jgi:pimeloyl-ACP methyl ester carboxylesterase